MLFYSLKLFGISPVQVLFDLACFRGLGNSGGQTNFASLYVFASLLVILRRSRSASVMAVILHPTVLNSSVALRISSA